MEVLAELVSAVAGKENEGAAVLKLNAFVVVPVIPPPKEGC